MKSLEIAPAGADRVLSVLARLTRRLPAVRGLGRVYLSFNQLMLRAGAAPVVEVPMRDGTRMRVDLRTRTEVHACYRGEYDRATRMLIREVLDPDAHFVDVGANVGFHAVSVAHHLRALGGSGRVYAYEPLPTNFERLRENVALNALQGHCRCFQTGLSDRRTMAELVLREDFEHGSPTGNASIAVEPRFDQGFTRVAVQLEPLDRVWPEHSGGQGRIGVIKLDIEGHEDFFLSGAADTLRLHQPVVLMEVNKAYYRGRGVDLDAAFRPHIPQGYTILSRANGGWRAIASIADCTDFEDVVLLPAAALRRHAGVFA